MSRKKGHFSDAISVPKVREVGKNKESLLRIIRQYSFESSFRNGYCNPSHEEYGFHRTMNGFLDHVCDNNYDQLDEEDDDDGYDDDEGDDGQTGLSWAQDAIQAAIQMPKTAEPRIRELTDEEVQEVTRKWQDQERQKEKAKKNKRKKLRKRERKRLEKEKTAEDNPTAEEQCKPESSGSQKENDIIESKAKTKQSDVAVPAEMENKSVVVENASSSDVVKVNQRQSQDMEDAKPLLEPRRPAPVNGDRQCRGTQRTSVASRCPEKEESQKTWMANQHLDRKESQKTSVASCHLEREESQKTSVASRHPEREESQKTSVASRRPEREESQKSRVASRRPEREESQKTSVASRRPEREESQKTSVARRRLEREQSQKTPMASRRPEREESQKTPMASRRPEREESQKTSVASQRLEREESQKTSVASQRLEREESQKTSMARRHPEREESQKTSVASRCPEREESETLPQVLTIPKDDSNIKGEMIKVDVEDPSQRSQELGCAGNYFASCGQFEMALNYFTEAIKHNPKEYKLFGNRSFCYERMQLYDKALLDADVALSLQPNWVKGLFRRGKALCGLKRYHAASLTYKDVLKQDSSSVEAAQELRQAQTLHLQEMGFTATQSAMALHNHGTFEDSVEALFAGEFPQVGDGGNGEQPAEEEEEEEDWTVVKPRCYQRPSQSVGEQSISPSRPRELFPVWVGSLPPGISRDTLQRVFNRAGPVYSVKLLPALQCAFVNYTQKLDCERAIALINGLLVEGSPLAVRYPLNNTPKGVSDPHPTSVARSDRECYFWRTAGCLKQQCQFRHVPEHEHIDIPPDQTLGHPRLPPS